jgi:hypothetical protein
LRILESAFELCLHVLSVESMAVIIIIYHLLVSDVS